MNSVEKVKAICKDRKIALSRLEKDLGFSNGYIGQLRKGVFPSDRLGKISTYLDISIEDLMPDRDDTSCSVLTSKDKNDIAKDLRSIMSKLNSKEEGPASFDGEDISEADRELFAGQLELMLTRLKKINKELYNPNKNKK